MDAFEAQGHWWVAANPDLRVAGTLKVGPHDPDIQLTLLGSLGPSDRSPFRSLEPLPEIHGTLQNGKQVTLVDCHVGGGSHSPFAEPPTVTVRYLCEGVVIGDHLESDPEPRFGLASARFRNLQDWSGKMLSVEDREHLAGDGDDGFGAESVTISAPASTTASAPFGSIDVWNSMVGGTGWYEFSRRVETWVTFELDPPLPISAIVTDVLKPFQYFLELSTGAWCPYTQVRFTSSEVHDEEPSLPLEYCHLGWDFEAVDEDRRLYSWEMLLPLTHIVDTFEETYGRFLALLEKADRVLDLMLALRNPRMRLYLDTRFLFAAQALELLHRRCVARPGPSAEHEARLQEILDAVPQHKKWLKWRLNYSHEPSLRERVEEILARVPSVASQVASPDFSSLVSDTRNYLTHYDERLHAKAAHDHDLFELEESVVFILEAWLLAELGLDDQEQLQALTRTGRWRGMADRRSFQGSLDS